MFWVLELDAGEREDDCDLLGSAGVEWLNCGRKEKRKKREDFLNILQDLYRYTEAAGCSTCQSTSDDFAVLHRFTSEYWERHH